MADSEARASVFMNRRIRNRTSGGVGGRRGWKHPRLLPDRRGSLKSGISGFATGDRAAHRTDGHRVRWTEARVRVQFRAWIDPRRWGRCGPPAMNWAMP